MASENPLNLQRTEQQNLSSKAERQRKFLDSVVVTPDRMPLDMRRKKASPLARNVPGKTETSNPRSKASGKSVFNVDLEKYSKIMKVAGKMPGTIVKK